MTTLASQSTRAPASDSQPGPSSDAYFLNPSTRLTALFLVPLEADMSRHCRFELDEDPDFAWWVESLARAIELEKLTADNLVEVEPAPSLQELVDELDDETAQHLTELGLLTGHADLPRWRWRSDVRIILSTRSRQMGQPLWETRWGAQWAPRVMEWVRLNRSKEWRQIKPDQEELLPALRHAKVLVQRAPEEVRLERCFANDPLPEGGGPWVTNPKHHFENSLLWVQDLATGSCLPAHVEPADMPSVIGLTRAELGVNDLPVRLKTQLWQAGLLVDSSRERSRGTHIIEQQSLGAQQLEARGQATLRGIVAPSELLRWGRYCNDLCRAGYFPPMNTQGGAPRRTRLYAEPAIRLLHQPLAELLSQVAGEALEPSYCILARYFEGATLPRHVDRPQCVWNLSLVLHWQSSESPVRPWPFFVEGPGGVVNEVLLRPGDGVLYRGTLAPHWRESLPPGNETTIAFFHFVPPTFTGYRN